jgi:hypothetical protein
MWTWLHSGWFFLLIPLAMMLACILMCVFACGFRSGGGCAGCCGMMRNSENHSRRSS